MRWGQKRDRDPRTALKTNAAVLVPVCLAMVSSQGMGVYGGSCTLVIHYFLVLQVLGLLVLRLGWICPFYYYRQLTADEVGIHLPDTVACSQKKSILYIYILVDRIWSIEHSCTSRQIQSLLESRVHSGNRERPLRLFWDSSKSCEPPYLFQRSITQIPSWLQPQYLTLDSSGLGSPGSETRFQYLHPYLSEEL